MRLKKLLIVPVALLVVMAGASFFANFALATDGSDLVFRDVWARAASEGHMSAVYMHVTNEGAADVAIAAAFSDVAEQVEVHETIMEVMMEDGRISQIMRMEELEVLEVPAGGSVELKPGGLHIMLIGLTRDIESGDQFTLELELTDGRRIALDVPVQVGTDDDGHDHHDH